MSNFVLKIIACVTMFLGHIPFAFPALVNPCLYIGRLAFPIFAFLISEGYVHTKSFSKYLKRLFVFAIISQIPAYLLFFNDFSYLYFNIFFTLAFGLLSIRIYDKVKNKIISWPLIIILAFLAEVLGFDFGAVGVLMILVFYITKNRSKGYMILYEFLLMFALFADDFLVKTVTKSYLIATGAKFVITFSALIPIVLYNGKLGKNNKKNKLAFYLFYPIHLTLLCVLKYFL